MGEQCLNLASDFTQLEGPGTLIMCVYTHVVLFWLSLGQDGGVVQHHSLSSKQQQAAFPLWLPPTEPGAEERGR